MPTVKVRFVGLFSVRPWTWGPEFVKPLAFLSKAPIWKMFCLSAGTCHVTRPMSDVLPLLITIGDDVKFVYTSPIAPPFDAAMRPYEPERIFEMENEPLASAKVV